LADLLGKIQKALGEYLERERSSFPRFYFVGDEDLLEIIGNSKNIGRLQKHFKKMFAGISAVILNEDATAITGVSSREGEEVRFLHPVDLVRHPKINDWLMEVEKEMRLTLADRLSEAVSRFRGLRSGGVMLGFETRICSIIGWSQFLLSADRWLQISSKLHQTIA
jgi:dynein heavy chain 1